ncbi:MAG: carboxypeptidase-like regulatory domain-containing protein [Sandaracinaceae bacterium]|nr:carboxypeptidase-like regulatory domain-containing protein [Sandaracinaceae bacterium]
MSADASLVVEDGGVVEATECAPFAALDGAQAPVAGALLLLSELNEVEDTPVRTVEARAGQDGQATLCRRAGHTAMIDAWDDEGRWGRRSWWGPIRPGEPIPIYLAEPSTLSGRVVDAGGAPLAGASIELWPFPRGYEPATQRLSNQRSLASGADGAFAVDLPYAQMVAVTASAPGFVEALVEPVIVDGMVAPIELVLREESLVTGIVRLRGAPVEGARIMAPHTTLWTDASGRFELHGVARGEEVELGIAAAGALRTLVRTVGEGDHVFDLPPATELVVIANLPSSMSECAAGTYVEVEIHPGGPPEVASDDDTIETGGEPGEAVVHDLDPGRYWVSAWAAGSEAQTEVRLAEGERGSSSTWRCRAIAGSCRCARPSGGRSRSRAPKAWSTSAPRRATRCAWRSRPGRCASRRATRKTSTTDSR